MKWYDISEEAFDVYGMNRRFERLPEAIAKTVNDGVAIGYNIPAGGRLRFSTNSKMMAIKAVVTEHRNVGFDLYHMVDGHEIFSVGFRNVAYFICNGEFEAVNTVSDGEKIESYTLNFPYAAKFTSFQLGLDDDAVLLPGEAYVNEKPVVFYGSSITHGAWASRPGLTYEAMISQKYNLNYTNLGFSGAARGEPEIARYIAGLDMCAFVCDYDYNASGCEMLEDTHLSFYRIVREKHPDIPYIIITKPDFFADSEESGRRAEVIARTYEYAVRSGDKNVRLIEGKHLFDGEFYHNCCKDGVHPNDIGFYRMQQVIGPVLAETLGLECQTPHDIYTEGERFIGDRNPALSWWSQQEAL